MTKIKVRINPPTPSKEAIAKHKDFNAFMHRYQQYYTTRGIRHLLYNDRRKLVYLVIIIIFLLLMLFADDIESATPPGHTHSNPAKAKAIITHDKAPLNALNDI